MISSFYPFLIIASCFLIAHAYIDRRYVPLNDLSVYTPQDYDLNDDQIVLSRRAAHFIFSPTGLVSSSKQANDYRDYLPSKRQSFGRKNHWDAFFGRRR